jgi:hypothetical protein
VNPIFAITETCAAAETFVGYWEANLQGLAHVGRLDRAELLVDYLHLSEAQIVAAADHLVQTESMQWQRS